MIIKEFLLKYRSINTMDLAAGTVALLILIVCLVNDTQHQANEVDSRKRKDAASISFITGADKAEHKYYAYAAEYFTLDSAEGTDVVVSSCTTLECLIQHLNTSNLYYDTINIVAHGNAKTGLNIWLSQDGHKATPKRMVQELLLQSLPTIDKGILDSNSVIRVFSCGIGHSLLTKIAMPQLFITEDGKRPKVELSDKFVVFKPDANGEIRKVAASYWPYYFKRGYRPSESEIAHEMQKTYAKTNKNWNAMMGSEHNKMAYTFDYHLPISYTKYYENKDERPMLTSKEEQMKWARSQPEILAQLEELDLDFNQFHWQVNRIKILQEDQSYRYAVKAIGMTTVMCFVEEEQA